jgi:Nif-specific regulatory protein
MVDGEVIGAAAFPCRHNRCLTQTLHRLDKEDAVAPVKMIMPSRHPVRPPAREVAQSVPSVATAGIDDWDDGEAPESCVDVTHMGPTERLISVPSSISNEPPEGERERLIWAMRRCAWVQSKAARMLGVTPRQLGYALHKHNIEVRKF